MKAKFLRAPFIILLVVVAAALAMAFKVTRHDNIKLPGQTVGGRRVLYYTDPMHPAYKSDKPGIAPDCGMRLEPVFADEPKTDSSPAMSPASVVVNPEIQHMLGVRLAVAERSPAAQVIHAVGRVLPEDTRIYKLNSGVDGFIRETYNDSVGTLVRKNQRLASYYAPDFLAAASGFLAANERVPGSVTKEGAKSIQNYTDRLRNLGMSDVQIQKLADTHQLPESIDVVSPVDGFILSRSVSPGQHFTRDMAFYEIADLSRVWIAAEIDERDARYIHPGSTAQLTLRDGGRRLTAHITNSLPRSEAGGSTEKIRLEVENAQFVLRPEMLIDVQLPVHLREAVTVPLDALIDSGEHKRVYVARDGETFEPREVSTGWISGDRVEILNGVKPGERVVASATFLIDSETRLKAPAALGANPQTGR
jgi:Cu(I)/Ag(I) efflux system membrane fusion protein